MSDSSPNPFKSKSVEKSDLPPVAKGLPDIKTLVNAEKSAKLVAVTKVTSFPISTIVCQHVREEFIMRHNPYHLISNGVRLFGEPVYYSSFEIALSLRTIPISLKSIVEQMPTKDKMAVVTQLMIDHKTRNVHNPELAKVSVFRRVQLSYNFFKQRYFQDAKKAQYFLHRGRGKFSEVTRFKALVDDLRYVWSNPTKYFDVVPK